MQQSVRVTTVFIVVVFLGACTGGDYLLVKKGDLSAAQECLMVQKQYQTLLESQQDQLQDTLGLLRDSIQSYSKNIADQQSLLERAEIASTSLSTESRKDSSENCSIEQPDWVDKKIIGRIEDFLLTDVGVVMPGRADTGAETSSLDARDIQEFERNGEDWVRFTIVDPKTEESVEVERERVRLVRIFQSADEEGERRPVVKMRITLGSVDQVVEFTLTDRSHLDTPMLIGRNFLRDMMLVDVSRKNLIPLVPDESDDDDGQDAE